VYNAGVSSDTVALAKARIATDVTPKFLTGVDNICIINLGTNDLDQGANATTVIASLTDLIATIKGLGWKAAVMTLANLFTPYIDDEATVNGYIATINSWILANTEIDFKIDLNERLRDSTTGLSNRQYVRVYDGVHFSSPAQRIIATTVLKSLGLD
jgi:lysophospholipase L1-like esterase